MPSYQDKANVHVISCTSSCFGPPPHGLGFVYPFTNYNRGKIYNSTCKDLFAKWETGSAAI